MSKLPHPFSRMMPETKIGYLLCKEGYHWWWSGNDSEDQRSCVRCEAKQELKRYRQGNDWEYIPRNQKLIDSVIKHKADKQ